MKALNILLSGTFLLSASAFTFALPDVASAHEGEPDSLGCHYARNHRNYHCHEGVMEGMTFQSRGEAIRNWNRLKKGRENKDDDDDDGF